MEIEPNNQIIQQNKPQKKRFILIIGGIIITFLVIILIRSFVFQPQTSELDWIEQEPARKNLDSQIYTVEELSNKFRTNPLYFTNKEIKVKALSVGGTWGVGCTAYSIAGDLTADEYNISLTPKTRGNRPTINSIGIAEYGVYTGHFFDKNWVKQCKEPGMFVVTDYEKIDINLPSLSKNESVSSGYIIFEGKLLRHPYEIAIQGNNITVNGLTYQTVNSNSPSRNKLLESSFDNLVKYMQQGDLEIVYDYSEEGLSSRNIPNTGKWNPQEMVIQADEVIKSNLNHQEKKEKLALIFDMNDYYAQYLDDMIENWNK